MIKISFGSLNRSIYYNFRLEFLILPPSSRLKPNCDAYFIHFYYTLEQLSMDEKEDKKYKQSLRNEYRQTTHKRLKRGDENELERYLSLEMVVASKQLRMAV